ncbi:MAG: hypothetical protein AB7P69_18920 [Candidatus Binatia bacterium]
MAKNFSPAMQAIYYGSFISIILTAIYRLANHTDMLALEEYFENYLFLFTPWSIDLLALPLFLIAVSLLAVGSYVVARQRLSSESERNDFFVVFILVFPTINLFFLALAASIGGSWLLGLFLVALVYSFFRRNSPAHQL